MSYLRERLRRQAILRQEEAESTWEQVDSPSLATLSAMLSQDTEDAFAVHTPTTTENGGGTGKSSFSTATLTGGKVGAGLSSSVEGSRSTMAGRLEQRLLRLRQAVEYGGESMAESAVQLVSSRDGLTPDALSRYWERDVRRYDNGF